MQEKVELNGDTRTNVDRLMEISHHHNLLLRCLNYGKDILNKIT